MQGDLNEFFGEGKVYFPLRRAFAFALKSIRIRLSRMLIVLVGVASAIAFMTMLFCMATFTGDASATAGEAGARSPEAPRATGQVEDAIHGDPSRVVEVFAAETVDSSAVARAFRPWWLLIALGISVAGITNAVLMSVTERIKEIGTLKCLGAMSYHIVEIFLIESILIGFIGGALGALVGIGLASANLLLSGGREAGLQIPTILELAGTFAAGVCFSVLIALVASVVPVFVAARIQPADAMRYEV